MEGEYESDEPVPDGVVITETEQSWIISRPSGDNKPVVVKQFKQFGFRRNPYITARWQEEIDILKVIASASGHVCETQSYQCSNRAATR